MKCNAMSLSGTSALYFLFPKTTMNGSRYLKLSHKLNLHMQLPRRPIFMHDNANCHRLKAISIIIKGNYCQQRLKAITVSQRLSDSVENSRASLINFSTGLRFESSRESVGYF